MRDIGCLDWVRDYVFGVRVFVLSVVGYFISYFCGFFCFVWDCCIVVECFGISW